MKKFFAILLVLTVFLSLGVTAYAQTISEDGGSSQCEIHLTGEPPVTYSVTVDFPNLNFSYDGYWQPPSRTVRVDNHSNVPISVSESLKDADGVNVGSALTYNGVTLTAQEGSVTLAAEGADDHDCLLSIAVNGTPEKSMNNDLAGYLVITISKVS